MNRKNSKLIVLIYLDYLQNFPHLTMVYTNVPMYACKKKWHKMILFKKKTIKFKKKC